jgi:hypothetical protein
VPELNEDRTDLFASKRQNGFPFYGNCLATAPNERFSLGNISDSGNAGYLISNERRLKTSGLLPLPSAELSQSVDLLGMEPPLEQLNRYTGFPEKESE